MIIVYSHPAEGDFTKLTPEIVDASGQIQRLLMLPDKSRPRTEQRGSTSNPIPKFGQHVNEYQGKYGLYCFLNENLENTRNVFLRLGNDLEKAKGRDTKEYFRVQKELKEMYIRYGMRHKQMKVIFTVLHEELKNLKEMIRDFVQCYAKD